MDAAPTLWLPEPAVTSLIAREAGEGTGVGSPLGYGTTVEFPRERHFRDHAAPRSHVSMWHAALLKRSGTCSLAIKRSLRQAVGEHGKCTDLISKSAQILEAHATIASPPLSFCFAA
jgi:hypothetical protein